MKRITILMKPYVLETGPPDGGTTFLTDAGSAFSIDNPLGTGAHGAGSAD